MASRAVRNSISIERRCSTSLGHFGGEEHGAVTALVLGLIERDVGVAHQFVGCDAIVGRHGEADRSRHTYILAIDGEGHCEGLGYALRDRRTPPKSTGMLRITNSSPPKRERKSCGLRRACKRSPTAFINWSPASWPSVSLMSLKRSMSM